MGTMEFKWLQLQYSTDVVGLLQNTSPRSSWSSCAATRVVAECTTHKGTKTTILLDEGHVDSDMMKQSAKHALHWDTLQHEFTQQRTTTISTGWVCVWRCCVQLGVRTRT